jgi:O-antigen ligase
MLFMVVPEDFDYASIGGPLPGSGNALSRLVWLLLLIASGTIVLRRLSLASAMLRQLNGFFVAFVLLALASVLWSEEPQFTARRLIRLVTIVLVALAFFLVPRRGVQEVLRPMITLLLFGSIALVVLAPDLAIERSGSSELAGAWHGLATQKNGLGSLAAISTLLWLHAWQAREARAPAVLCGTAISLLCLLCSRSSSSILATAFSAPLMMFLARTPQCLRRHMPWLVGIFAAALLLYSLAILRWVPGLEILLRLLVRVTGKDPTFSGRTAIWSIMSEHIAEHPALGSGYGAYWIGPTPGSQSYAHVTRLFFYPTEAHNGYLDVISDLGAVGGACLLGYLLVYLRQALRVLAAQRAQGVLYVGLFFEQLIANLSESRWLNVLCIEFVIMTLATAGLGRAELEYRIRDQGQARASRAGRARRA